MAIDKTKEQKHLDFVRSDIAKQKEKLFNFLTEQKDTVMQKQAQFKEVRSGTKLKDIIEHSQEVDEMVGEYAEKKIVLNCLSDALDNPYFGKVVFAKESDDIEPSDIENLYIGKFGIQSDDKKQILVTDWRAPVSSLFYDFELGPASHPSPRGLIKGDLKEKLQFSIEKGKIKWVISTSVTINDELLQQALSENTKNTLKTIVATIQKNQNQIIRQDLDKTTIVQGVAGSGKTSIAMHRIAYLLYNNRSCLSSSEILIFSHSHIFASYISSILPELGEQNVKEICFDDIFKNEFDGIVNFETRTEQVEHLLKHSTDANTELGKAALKQIKLKNSYEFVKKLTKFLDLYFENNFTAKSVKIDPHQFEAKTLEKYLENKTGSIYDKMQFLANSIVSLIDLHKRQSEKQEQFLYQNALNACLKMLKQKNIFKIYSAFLNKMRLPQYNRTFLDAEDAYALLFIKNYIFGPNTKNQSIKHVVIDEMQDLSATALAIIEQMYPCPKTILGDFNQMIDEPYSEEKLKLVEHFFCKDGNGKLFKLEQNYRSTAQNSIFSNDIANQKTTQEFVRNGQKPTIIVTTTTKHNQAIIDAIEQCKADGYKTVAILTKTSMEASTLFANISNLGHTMSLVLPRTKAFRGGILIAAAHLVKGLEFDAVIIADASQVNYQTSIDRQSLYIATTRALHKIFVVSAGELTHYIKQ